LGLVFVLVASCLLLLVTPCVAPVMVPDNPSGPPEIVSVKINSNHRYCPPEYYTNPYTGAVTQTLPARYQPNGTIEITIKNAPFTPYTNNNGQLINMYYAIFSARGVGLSWDSLLELTDKPWYAVYQSNTEYTVVTATYFANLAPPPHLCIMYEGEKVSFYVQAVTGYFIPNSAVVGSNAVFEGVGSEPAIFEVTIPVTAGTPQPTTTTIVSSATSKPSSSSNVVVPSGSPFVSDGPFTSDIYYFPSQSFPFSRLVIFVLVCVILISALVFVLHVYKRRQTVFTKTNSAITFDS
jgi:hypothetical protein